MVFSTTDDAGAVEKTLYAPQAGEEYFSIYEASERTYLVPESNTWMAVADRASWLALYCFTRSRDRDDFLRMFPHLNFFDSMGVYAGRFPSLCRFYDARARSVRVGDRLLRCT